MDELLKEFQEVDSTWSKQENQTIELLESLLMVLDHGKEIPKAIQTRLSNQGEEWKSLHAQISKYTKVFEKKVKGDFVDLIQSNDNEQNHQDEAITQCLLQHFYREGNFEIGDLLAEEMQSMTDVHLKEPFEEMHNLVKALNDRNIMPTIEWVTLHEKTLGPMGTRLKFQLHSLAFIKLLQRKGSDSFVALQYARKWLAPFQSAFPEDLETLMGALAYGDHLESSPYNVILFEEMWGEAEDSLVAAYCSVLGLPKESSLRLCLNIGTNAWPKISKVLSIMRERPGVEWNPQEELPVEIETGVESRFHSVFVCPVLRQQTNSTNPPMLMPCGHVICQEALTRLSKGNQNYRIKCPYCPAESTAAMAQQIIF